MSLKVLEFVKLTIPIASFEKQSCSNKIVKQIEI